MPEMWKTLVGFAVLLGILLLRQPFPGTVKCGPRIMQPGDSCEISSAGQVTGTYTYEEMKQRQDRTRTILAVGLGGSLVGSVFFYLKGERESRVIEEAIEGGERLGEEKRRSRERNLLKPSDIDKLYLETGSWPRWTPIKWVYDEAGELESSNKMGMRIYLYFQEVEGGIFLTPKSMDSLEEISGSPNPDKWIKQQLKVEVAVLKDSTSEIIVREVS